MQEEIAGGDGGEAEGEISLQGKRETWLNEESYREIFSSSFDVCEKD